jgi:AAA domain
MSAEKNSVAVVEDLDDDENQTALAKHESSCRAMSSPQLSHERALVSSIVKMTADSSQSSSSSAGAPPVRALRIALSGGPFAGKTSAVNVISRELADSVCVVPEAATLLFSGGFPRCDTANKEAMRYQQRTIYQLQTNLEDMIAVTHPSMVLLADRGTVDGAVYWDNGDFFEAMGTTLEEQLARYDGIIFFESAAHDSMALDGNNPHRSESVAEAKEIDVALHRLWRRHERFRLVPNCTSFFEKLLLGISAFKSLVAEIHWEQQHSRRSDSKELMRPLPR